MTPIITPEEFISWISEKYNCGEKAATDIFRNSLASLHAEMFEYVGQLIREDKLCEAA